MLPFREVSARTDTRGNVSYGAQVGPAGEAVHLPMWPEVRGVDRCERLATIMLTCLSRVCSKNYPYCDGSHTAYNREHGTNLGPTVVDGGEGTTF